MLKIRTKIMVTIDHKKITFNIHLDLTAHNVLQFLSIYALNASVLVYISRLLIEKNS